MDLWKSVRYNILAGSFDLTSIIDRALTASLGILGLGIALYIGNEQIKLAKVQASLGKEQIELSNKQIDISNEQGVIINEQMRVANFQTKLMLFQTTSGDMVLLLMNKIAKLAELFRLLDRLSNPIMDTMPEREAAIQADVDKIKPQLAEIDRLLNIDHEQLKKYERELNELNGTPID